LATDLENISIARYMREYAQILQAEADKLELLGVKTEPSLFDKAQEVFFLSEQVHQAEKTGLKLVLNKFKST